MPALYYISVHGDIPLQLLSSMTLYYISVNHVTSRYICQSRDMFYVVDYINAIGSLHMFIEH